MPLINGQKMACEPCIRGHRSTKCSHANERLMVPVRKPGRPLSSCPHLASRPCSCAAVTAAIPKKKQTCHCGTSEPAVVHVAVAVDGQTRTDEISAEASPTPSSASKSVDSIGHRVQKSTGISSITKGGKQSKKPIDPATLERMDASQLNIVPSTFDAAYLKLPPKLVDVVAPVSGNAGYSTGMGYVAPDASLDTQANVLMYQASLAPASITHPTVPKPSTNGHYSSKAQMNEDANGGETPQVQSNIHMVAKTNGEQKNGSKSRCCSNADSAPEVETQEELKPAPESHFQVNGAMMNTIPAPMTMPNGMFPYMSPSTVFAYPPQYGSYLQPLQPEQWRHLMATMTVGYQMPGMAYGAPPGVSMLPMNHVNGHMNGQVNGQVNGHVNGHANGLSWTSHQCSCGESCQCVGCATHPYNEATQNYVRSAWNTMLEDSPKVVQPDEGDQSNTPANRTPNNGMDASAMNASHDDPSSPVMPTPSDSASGISEEQTLSANDFFFVSYPFRECEGEMASCPCGDDCACIGCAIHGNFRSTQQPE